jgi:hypothetical protein
MDTRLLDGHSDGAGPADGSLMRALSPFGPPEDGPGVLSIAVEDDDGNLYRLIRTRSLCEAVRISERARDMGFVVGPGRKERACTCHKTLRFAPGAVPS